MNINSVSSYQNTRNFGARLQDHSAKLLLENGFSQQDVENLKEKISTSNDNHFMITVKCDKYDNDTWEASATLFDDALPWGEWHGRNRDKKKALRKCISVISDVKVHEDFIMLEHRGTPGYDPCHREWWFGE